LRDLTDQGRALRLLQNEVAVLEPGMTLELLLLTLGVHVPDELAVTHYPELRLPTISVPHDKARTSAGDTPSLAGIRCLLDTVAAILEFEHDGLLTGFM
jgi:hypothetical protein